MIYRFFFHAVLRRLDAERAHDIAAWCLRVLMKPRTGRTLVRRAFGAKDPILQVRLWGQDFPSPLGVAAGMDKEANWFDSLGPLGFGFVEIGTVTGLAQPGRQGKRIWRLTKDRALLNSMGFPNPGAEVIGERLKRRTGETLVGVNLGKSKIVEGADQVALDYRASVRHVAAHCEYLVVNVSSPNTPGLRDLQADQPLRKLIQEVRDELQSLGRWCPVLVKISPDVADSDINQIGDLAVELKLDGIVAVNTTVHRAGLSCPTPADAQGTGGISGAPLKGRSVEVLRLLRARVGTHVPLISVGGVEDAQDVWKRLACGASLVQAHTGFVYGGPLWPHRINRELAKRLRETGMRSVEDLIGTDTAAGDSDSAELAFNGNSPRREPALVSNSARLLS